MTTIKAKQNRENVAAASFFDDDNDNTFHVSFVFLRFFLGNANKKNLKPIIRDKKSDQGSLLDKRGGWSLFLV